MNKAEPHKWGSVDSQRFRRYAKDRFHRLNDSYRRYLVDKDAQTRVEYDMIVTNGDPVSKRNLVLPEFIGGFASLDGKDYQNHLYADGETGLARIKLNSWEEGVLELERQRNDFACWVRNQPNSKWALCVPYRLNGQKKGFYPDFLIVRWDNAAKSGFVVDILEPHGQQFADSLAKAKGLAEYAADEDRIGRVQIIRKVRAREVSSDSSAWILERARFARKCLLRVMMMTCVRCLTSTGSRKGFHTLPRTVVTDSICMKWGRSKT